MTKPRDPKIFLYDILYASKNCLDFTKGMDFNSFDTDLKTISAVQHQILIIGEATKRLGKEFSSKYPELPWKQMAGTRDMLIHAYEEADHKIIWNIAKVQIPDLIPKIQKVLEDL